MEKTGSWLTKKAEKVSKSLLFPGSSRKKERKRLLFEENGRELLKEVIKCSKDGLRCNPIRTFSADQVLQATHHFDPNNVFHRVGWRTWYKGSFDGRPLLFNKYQLSSDHRFSIRDIVVSSQMSNHRNVLKLLGCCLEFEDPILVYESAANGPLSNFVVTDTLSWKLRLKIAKDVANAITYLHTAFPRPIIHRAITPPSIFLDENYSPKLGGFPLSISIPEGELQVEVAPEGNIAYLDPHYLQTSYVSELSDVYSFGVLLLVLLTGKKAYEYTRRGEGINISRYVGDLLENGQVDDIVDGRLFEDEEKARVEEHRLQIFACLELAMRCVSSEPGNRPLMIDVAKKLVEIATSTGLTRAGDSAPV